MTILLRAYLAANFYTHHLSSLQKPTNIDLINSCDLAPSTRLKSSDMVEVLCYILGMVKRADMRDVISPIKGTMLSLSHEAFIAPYERENTPLVMDELQQHRVAFQKHQQVTMHLQTKEASGTALLGTFMLCVSDALETLCPTQTFRIDHQFNVCDGKTYTADSALLSALLVSSQKPVGFDPSQSPLAGGVVPCFVVGEVVPCFVVAYKPRVSQDLVDQEPCHLTEVFLQAYYLCKMHKHPILHCLTDLSDFHCFLVKGSDRGNLEIKKYFYSKCNFNETEELLLTLKLLCYIIIESCLSQLL